MLSRIFGENGLIAKALSSNLYLWVCGIVTFLAWNYYKPYQGLLVLFALSFLVFVFCKDTTPAMASFVFLFFVFRDRNIEIEGNLIWLSVLLFPLVGAIINLIRFKPAFSLKGFSLSVLLCAVPWLLQGVTRAGRELLPTVYCIGIAVLFIIVYMIFATTTRTTDGNKSLEKYAVIMLVMSTLFVCQVIMFFTWFGSWERALGAIGDNAEEVHLGWGGRNTLSSILVLTMPVTFYFATKKHWYSPLLALYGVFQFFTVLVIGSRGTMLVAVLVTPVMVVYSLIKAKHKIGVAAAYVIVAGLVGLLVWKNADLIGRMFYRLKNEGFTMFSRESLYEEAIDVFFKYPVFGAGFDYRSELYFSMRVDSNGPTYYHSTFLQIFASLGIVGAIAYFNLYYWRYRTLLTDFNSLKFFLLCGFVMFEVYNFVDTNFFQPQSYLIMLLLSLMTEKCLSYEQAKPLITELAPRKRTERAVTV